MKNFDWTSFTQRIIVNAPLEKLYAAWSRSGELEKWFLSSATFEDHSGKIKSSDGVAVAGDVYTWHWFKYDLDESGKVTAANGTDHFAFKFAGDCDVDIKLIPDHEKVLVQLTQSNIPTDEHSKQEIRLGCASGWAFFLVNLKSIYEGGIDLREKDERVNKPLVNC